MKVAGSLLMVSSLLSSVVFANALVRVTPRSDYGAQSPAFSRIKDRWDQKGALAQGQMMGGNYDVVLEKDPATSEISVNRCPTLKACFDVTPDAQAACFTQAQHWNCETIYKNTPDNFCRFYAIGHRAQAVVHFIGDQFLGGLITGPFAFFQKGIGLAATRVSTGFSAYNALKTIVTTECSDVDPAATVAEGTVQAQVSSVKVFTELEKGEVRNFIEMFTPPQGTARGEMYELESSVYPQAHQIPLK